MTSGDSPDDVRDRVEEIQRKHRGRIRWRITRHTAEIAIRAIESEPAPRRARSRVPGKSRRRKRHKRLL